MAINRLFAIFFPLKYDLIFGIKATLAFHIIVYLDRARNLTFENIDRYNQSNWLLYNVQYLAYGGLMESADIMFIWALALTFIPFVFNAITFARFYHIRKQATRDSEKWIQARKNMIKFVQTVFQDSVYPISVVSNMKLNTLIHHRFWYFFSQTFVWQTLHTLDGFIMVMFNDRLTLLKKLIAAKISPAQSQQRGPNVMSPPEVIVAEPMT
ncbi:hypothetical protein CAEBREN_10057 [Caenorhabditis brenneri]|uniref:7TM GPCR serpentine receptor class x (Srx) domain-containing protein n=1 Tax=Caenorhabditis brenneri TaxID=135651 RepID=G0MUI7_CAEBE|nr:hypothetical protein CAEBREN_10057 [Caenorhabditis brenneri]